MSISRKTDHDERRRRIAAQWVARKAVLEGRLRREPCAVGEDCKGTIEAHHDNYDEPLRVRWLCRRHHQRWHRHYAAS